ncbi:Xylulokinase [Oceanicola granulosus HTCC2516]|uniref:Xylulose kinase n=1 Tax=Oceanicola granulosus (strain ATCC BAA-861 / DSM 15982 / KCTC 12143 / HTCC2516) TaxID=314256 RepID=Q2CAE6_OCEGH|nr:xylulokinase [Oceanicola granulosus]EAR49653.1 Xylulokinase [Oceanicola granulosus HTCC2516]
MSLRGHLGIDLGTSAVKVLVLDDEGRVLGRAGRGYATRAPRPGWAEQSPQAWWRATCEACREALAASGAAIASVGLSGQLNGFVLLDADDEPLADAVLWLDIRAEAETRRLAGAADFPALTGNALSAICVLPKLEWMRTQRPELLARAARIALVKDYILLRLTGILATDPSDAHSTALTETGGLNWSETLCALAQIDPARLPPIRAADEVAGHLTAGAAEAAGLAPGTPVATGAGDVAALAVGCGVVAPGTTAITLGTAGHVVAEAPAADLPAGGGLWQIPHGVPARTLWLGLIMSGGLSHAWMRSILGAAAPISFEAMEALAADVPAGADGVTFLPFLEGAATPYNRPDMRGSFFGLSSSHNTGHLVRAVLEGVACNARECLDALAAAGAGTREVRLAEGGAQSPLWCQIIADMLGRPVDLIDERDTSARGAALLGYAAAETVPIAELAAKTLPIARQYEPHAVEMQAHEESFARYQAWCRRALPG